MIYMYNIHYKYSLLFCKYVYYRSNKYTASVHPNFVKLVHMVNTTQLCISEKMSPFCGFCSFDIYEFSIHSIRKMTYAIYISFHVILNISSFWHLFSILKKKSRANLNLFLMHPKYRFALYLECMNVCVKGPTHNAWWEGGCKIIKKHK